MGWRKEKEESEAFRPLFTSWVPLPSTIDPPLPYHPPSFLLNTMITMMMRQGMEWMCVWGYAPTYFSATTYVRRLLAGTLGRIGLWSRRLPFFFSFWYLPFCLVRTTAIVVTRALHPSERKMVSSHIHSPSFHPPDNADEGFPPSSTFFIATAVFSHFFQFTLL